VLRSNDVTYFPFAIGREQPIPLQVLAAPHDGVAKPFAVVLRLSAGSRDFSNDHPILINGMKVGVTTFPNGNGQAAWTLADGTNAYMRSRDLDQAALVALVARLTPRDRNAPIPGFDLQTTTDPNGLVLLDEHLNTGLSGTVTMFRCDTGTNRGYYLIRVLDGDPVFVYFGNRRASSVRGRCQRRRSHHHREHLATDRADARTGDQRRPHHLGIPPGHRAAVARNNCRSALPRECSIREYRASRTTLSRTSARCPCRRLCLVLPAAGCVPS
jgi:hypothetical protein